MLRGIIATHFGIREFCNAQTVSLDRRKAGLI